MIMRLDMKLKEEGTT